jgi:hypothetical protein
MKTCCMLVCAAFLFVGCANDTWAPNHSVKIVESLSSGDCTVFQWDEWDKEWVVLSNYQPCNDMKKAWPNAKYVVE